MSETDFQINISIPHRIRFSREVFSQKNPLLADLLETSGRSKVIAFIDQGVAETFPNLKNQVEDYLVNMPNFVFKGVVIQAGGEVCKSDATTLQKAWNIIEAAGIDRHSYILCIGGGAYLDVIGMAAATAHRGIRFVRFPTTTLSQDDSGVGVKNGINAYGKKNFLGTFAVPYAVVNDFNFVHAQPENERRAGLVEAVKVALVKDASFFQWIEECCMQLCQLQPEILEQAVERSALLHAEHIANGGDPFETGSSRPLDFGHWSAHKMEQLTNFELSHADAVAIGIAVDSVYAWKIGLLREASMQRVLHVLTSLKLPTWHESLDIRKTDNTRAIIDGLEEFREHLGGELTLLLLRELGTGENVHVMNQDILNDTIDWLRTTANA
ncbi:MAG: 3-dehydroquinate synthase [Akkermansiaceae bacterium]